MQKNFSIKEQKEFEVKAKSQKSIWGNAAHIAALEYCYHNQKFISPFLLHFKLTALLVVLFLTNYFHIFIS